MLNTQQLKILVAAYKKNRYVTGSAISVSGATVSDVDALYTEGLLNKRVNKYKINQRGEKALENAGFTLSEMTQEPKPVRKPREVKVKQKDALVQELDLSVADSSLLGTVEGRQQIRYALALKKLQDGDPFDMVRLQWPELVIQCPIQKKYFAKYCDRTDNLDLRLDDRQVDLLKHAFDKGVQQIGIKGSTSPGKGFITAIAINLYYTCFPDSRIVLLGPSVAHSKNVMFAEVATWRKKMAMPGPGDILSMGIKDPNEEKHVLYIANPETGEGLSGAHGAHVLYVFDESSALSEDLFINAQKQAALIIAISNPRILSGWFYDLFPRSSPNDNQTISDRGVRRRLITFGGKDCINVKGKRLHVPQAPEGGLEIETIDGEKYTVAEYQEIPRELRPHVDALIPGQMDYRKYSQIMNKPNPIERAWSGEGFFPPEDADLQVIPPSWLVEPCNRWKDFWETIRVTAFGLDLAASEDKDWTVLAAGGPAGIRQIFKTRKVGMMETFAWMRGIFSKMGIDPFKEYYPIAVDWQGAGGNRVCDYLEAAGCAVLRVIPQGSPEDKSLYVNKRAEIYGRLADRINPESEHPDVFMLPDDNELKEELIAHEKIYAVDGIRYHLTPKKKVLRGTDAKVQSLKEILGRSPDSADAVTMCHEAILQTMIDEGIVDQFDPSLLVLGTAADSRDAEQVEYADGKVGRRIDEAVDVSIEDIQRSFEDTLHKISKFSQVFGNA